MLQYFETDIHSIYYCIHEYLDSEVCSEPFQTSKIMRFANIHIKP